MVKEADGTIRYESSDEGLFADGSLEQGKVSNFLNAQKAWLSFSHFADLPTTIGRLAHATIG